MIYTATLDDLDGVCAVETLSFGADAFSRRQLAYLILKAKGRFLVVRESGGAVDGDVFVGGVAGYISMTTNMRTCNLRIYSIAVHPAARGRGFAQIMLDTAMRYALDCGLNRITLEVNVGNAVAIALYAKNSYEKSGLRRNYYPDGSDAFVMTKMLL